MVRSATPEVVFILVRPQYSGNLGSVARVLRNFRQKELRLVSPAAPWTEEARRMAVGADALVQNAACFHSLKHAIADLQWTLATTSLRNRGDREPLYLRQVVKDIVKKATANRVGFIFGPEDSGLTDEEIGLCRALVHIPTSETYPTLNLAQAVAILAYELFLADLPKMGSRALAGGASLEGLFSHVREALLDIGFLHEKNPDRMLQVIRRILSRAQLSEQEVIVLRGICRQIIWASCSNARLEQGGQAKKSLTQE
ncbi:MAG: RNA methyltransferase [Acidobacteria bacterium]|nr:RNA methyltransferase [Acidobacteriota bacterium]